jgi:glycosyltransferase involved in cell wall biosynthesis
LYNHAMNQPKVALVHEFLVQYGGAEKTFEAIAELFPNAPIFTAKYDQNFISKMSPSMAKRTIIAPKVGLVNKASKYLFTFMMAPVFENMNFKDYDLVISDGNTWNKGIITRPNQLHITYMHTPPRFLYKYSTESSKRDKWYLKMLFSYLDNALRIWDYVAAQRPDFMLSNSQEVRKRIQKYYKRESTVIYPPIETEVKANYETDNVNKPYFLAGGRLARYKNFDTLISAFNLLGLPLTIFGTGNYEKALKKLAGPTITFKGAVSGTEKHKLFHNALGFINPVEDEDFGMVPVEAMTHGVPVLAHKSGGHLETVIEGMNGMFFDKNSVEVLVEKLKEFDKAVREKLFVREAIIESTQKFSKERFQTEFATFVKDKWDKFCLSQQGA